VQRSYSVAGKWTTTNHTFGPCSSERPPTDAVLFIRRAWERPDAWVPLDADDWDLCADHEITTAAAINADVVPPPPDIRERIDIWQKKRKATEF
jgi:hypothetical protein